MAIINYSQRLDEIVPGSTSITWRDILFSNKAKEKGLLSTQYNISSEVEQNLITLVTNVLHPLKTNFPGSFRINNGYRSPETNAAVGGAKTSQHMVGQAVDIDVTTGGNNKTLYDYVVANMTYDQIIWERGTPPPDGNPDWVHISFKSIGNRKQELYFDGSKYNPNDPNSSQEPTKDTKATAKDATPSFTGNSNKAGDLNGNVPTFQDTFKQIQTNVNNIEFGDTVATWGKRESVNEDSDWIGLKQYLLYLASRFTPQSLYPFVELIPTIKVQSAQDPNVLRQQSEDQGWVSEGVIPKEKEDELKKTSGGQKFLDELKFITELPPGYTAERFNAGANASNAASGNADLFNLDPFQEGLTQLYKLSKSGEEVKKQRNIGVRVYGQLVLSPAPIAGVPSKPGAVGFRSLEVNAGAQAEGGLALISMELVDVQGNKFTDINSPWGFIFDVRAGALGGDFWFRYGWQIRVPDPNDKADLSSKLFWNHPGWAIFGSAREDIKAQILPDRKLITLTQAINVGPSSESTKALDAKALFDEGIVFNETTGEVVVNRSNLLESNYVKLSILNPEITMDDRGALIAGLSFRTTGALAQSLPLEYAGDTRSDLVKNGSVIFLTDLLLDVISDSEKFGLLAIEDSYRRDQRKKAVDANIKSLKKSRKVDNLIYIVGLGDSGDDGTIHPDSIILKVSDKSMRLLTNPRKENSMTLIRWFRQVLQENECELQSAATGSGAGINSSWIITTTKKIDQDKLSLKKTTLPSEESNIPTNSQFINAFEQIAFEKDVFSYRFQGSLVESVAIEKTDTPNAMSIQADYTVGDLATFEGNPKDVTKQINKPISAAERKRNLQIVFAQMQNCTITCLCHPWIGPGKRVFIKGMGFYDGEYVVMQVTHKLDNSMKFITELIGSRILLKDKKSNKKQSIANAQEGGPINLAANAIKQIGVYTENNKAGGAGGEAISSVSNSDAFNPVITMQELKQIFPNASNKKIEALVEPLNDTLKKFNINTYLRVCHFLAQVGEETGEFAYYKEFGNQAYFTKYDNPPTSTFLGNTQPGDGYKFKGRGLLQLTGRSNYTAYKTYSGTDTVASPELLEKEYFACDSAGWYWTTHTFLGKTPNEWADTDDITKVTRSVNGGVNGLVARTAFLNKAKAVLQDKQFTTTI